MKILVVYIYVVNAVRSARLAERFVKTYSQFPAGTDHQLVIACNGFRHPKQAHLLGLFKSVPHSYFPRSNDGWDIGAYQEIAFKAPIDMMVCLGESTHFHRPGWLKRLAEAYEKHGPGMYGSFSSYLITPHLNTTGFAVGPEFLRGWPVLVKTKQQRYDFEHGQNSFCTGMLRIGRPVKLVTWDGEYDMPEWRTPPNLMWRGDQSNCLMWCKHSDNWDKANQETKERWSAGADGRPAVELQPA